MYTWWLAPWSSELLNSLVYLRQYYFPTNKETNQLTRSSLKCTSSIVLPGRLPDSSKPMIVNDSSKKFWKRSPMLQFLKFQPRELPMKKKLSSTTASTTKPRHGRCGKSQNGNLLRDLFSLNFSFPLVIQSVLSILCQESLIYQSRNTKNVKNLVWKTLYLLVVLVLLRLQSL